MSKLNVDDRGTVEPQRDFDVWKDVEHLKKAFEGSGTDERAIINILANRTWRQRSLVAEAYSKKYGMELSDMLSSEFNGWIYHILNVLATKPAENDARSLNSAMSFITEL